MFTSALIQRLGVASRVSTRFLAHTADSRSPHKPKVRPHILKDLIRERKIKHAIRRVTGENAEQPQGANASQTVKKDQKSENTELHLSKLAPNFHRLKLFGPLLKAIEDAGFTEPTPIQTEMIPLALKGHNIAASAQTGTGKTAAYALPVLMQIQAHKLNEQKQGIERDAAPLAIIVCPTRELCEQVEMQIYRLAMHMNGLRIIGLQGASKNVDAQIRAIKKGVDVLVCTPGRLVALMKPRDPGAKLKADVEAAKAAGKSMVVIDDNTIYEEIDIDDDEPLDDLEEEEEEVEASEALDLDEEDDFEDETGLEKFKKVENVDMNPDRTKRAEEKKRKKTIEPPAPRHFIIDMSHVRHFVLDEVDRMFAMGNFAEIKAVFDNLPRARSQNDGAKKGTQIMMLSATLVPRMRDLIRRFAPQHIVVDLNKAMQVAADVRHHVYSVGVRRKKGLLVHLLKKGPVKGKQALIFCRTRQRVERLVEQLAESKIVAQGLHGELPVTKRRAIVDSFLKKEFDVLISTDLLARGIDLPGLPCVINYDLPHNPEDYVHRVGRTGRAGAPGMAISIVSQDATTLQLRGKLVELDEGAFLKQISTFLGKKLKIEPLPEGFEDKSSKPEQEKSTDVNETSEKAQDVEDEDDEFVDEVPEPLEGRVRVTSHSKREKADEKSSKQEEVAPEKPRKEKKNAHLGMPSSIDDLFSRPSAASTAAKNQVKVNQAPKRSFDTGDLILAPIDEQDPLLKKAALEFRQMRQEKEDIRRAKQQIVEKLASKAKRVGATSTNNEPIETFPRKLLRRRLSRKQRLELFAATKKEQPSLRDFKEGRYEDMIAEFDKRKARKMGIHVPADFEERMDDKRKKIDKRKGRETERKQRRQMQHDASQGPKRFKPRIIRK